MDWEDKTKLVELGNQKLQHHDEFREFVMKHIEHFDNQAWSMFCNLINVTQIDIKQYDKFWSKIYNELQKSSLNTNFLSLRDQLRLQVISDTIKKQLNV